MAEQDTMTKALLAAIVHSTEPLVLSDASLPDYPMVAVNAAFEAMSGYPANEIIGRNCRFLQGPKTDPATPVRIGCCIRAGQGCIEWIVNHRKDGSAFWNVLFISPVRDAGGTLRYFLGNQLDVTQGFPDWLGEVVFGRAHMSPEVQAEFDALVHGIMRDPRSDEPDPARALERSIATARRLAELTTQLEGGAMVPPPGSPSLPAGVAVPARSAPAGPAG